MSIMFNNKSSEIYLLSYILIFKEVYLDSLLAALKWDERS